MILNRFFQKPHFEWSKFTGYECSSRGDKRFSAFYAILPDGRSIEEHYQCDVKGYDPGGRNWRLGKGQSSKFTYLGNDLYYHYLNLWKEWAKYHKHELKELRHAAKHYDYYLRDSFATSEINQARALADILNGK